MSTMRHPHQELPDTMSRWLAVTLYQRGVVTLREFANIAQLSMNASERHSTAWYVAARAEDEARLA